MDPSVIVIRLAYLCMSIKGVMHLISNIIFGGVMNVLAY